MADRSVRLTFSDCDFGSCFEEGSCVGVLGGGGHLFGGAGFDDAAALHDRDARAEIADDRHRMRNEEVGQAELALELLEEVDDLSADADVEGGDRFVGDDEFGAEGEGAGDADALALSAAEFVREAAGGGLVHANGVEEFGDTLAADIAAQAFVDDKRLGDDVFDSQSRVERAEGILKNDLQVAAEPAELGVSGGEQVVTVEVDAAGGGLDEAQDEAAEGAFARTGFAD